METKHLTNEEWAMLFKDLEETTDEEWEELIQKVEALEKRVSALESLSLLF